MEKPTRREALQMAALGTVLTAGTALAAGVAEAAPGGDDVEGSGKMSLSPQENNPRIDLKKESITSLSGGVGTSFVRMSPDAKPGDNTLTITGLPAGTRGITAWVTEWTPANGGSPHAGGAFFTTSSVQLFDNGRQCRVRFNLAWGTNLPAAAQVIFS